MSHENILNKQNCPVCGASLIGNEIPETLRKEFGNRSHYTRLVECYDWKTNQKTGYECPDCGEVFKTARKNK